MDSGGKSWTQAFSTDGSVSTIIGTFSVIGILAIICVGVVLSRAKKSQLQDAEFGAPIPSNTLDSKFKTSATSYQQDLHCSEFMSITPFSGSELPKYTRQIRKESRQARRFSLPLVIVQSSVNKGENLSSSALPSIHAINIEIPCRSGSYKSIDSKMKESLSPVTIPSRTHSNPSPIIPPRAVCYEEENIKYPSPPASSPPLTPSLTFGKESSSVMKQLLQLEYLRQLNSAGREQGLSEN